MKNINPHDLKQKLDNQHVILVDVREPAEYRAEHIPNSYLVPLNEVSISKLPVKNKAVVFLCRTGRRSGNVCEKFMLHHPEIDAYSLNGGINAWKESGFDVVTSSSKFIPLERQIQLAAGSLVLAGVIGGAFFNPACYLLSGFVGCGLIFAGLTGWCGMGRLLSKMPWNK